MATANLFYCPTCSSLPLRTARSFWSIQCQPSGASLRNSRHWKARPGTRLRWLATFSSCATTRKQRVIGWRCRLSRNDAVENGSATVAVAQFGVGMCLARSEHEAQSSGRRFCRRDSVWTAATCRRFCPRAQAKPYRIRPCREQKRQQAGALQTLARDTGGGQTLAFGHNAMLNRYVRRLAEQMVQSNPFTIWCGRACAAGPAGRRLQLSRRLVPHLQLHRSGLETAQIFNLSVSVEIVASRDDFAERGSVSRSTSALAASTEISQV